MFASCLHPHLISRHIIICVRADEMGNTECDNLLGISQHTIVVSYIHSCLQFKYDFLNEYYYVIE